MITKIVNDFEKACRQRWWVPYGELNPLQLARWENAFLNTFDELSSWLSQSDVIITMRQVYERTCWEIRGHGPKD